MLNRKERMEKMNAMGMDTSKYFTLNVASDIPAGAKIHVIIDKNGEYVISDETENDVIRNQIIEDGYVRNTKLFRRFVMAQMFHMLNFKSWNGKHKGYNDCLKYMYGYNYTFKMMTEEVRVLSKLEVRDRESFEERVHFFNQHVVIEVLCDYLDKLKKHVSELPSKNCKGVPYKRVNGMNVFVTDLDKKVYKPLYDIIARVRRVRNYTELYRELCNFNRNMIELPYDTAKSKVWIDTFKGAGAYYTLKNLVMFHDCGIKTDKFDVLLGTSAVAFLNKKLDEYQGEGWRMFALMKKVIADNNFDFNKRMEELGVK